MQKNKFKIYLNASLDGSILSSYNFQKSLTKDKYINKNNADCSRFHVVFRFPK